MDYEGFSRCVRAVDSSLSAQQTGHLMGHIDRNQKGSIHIDEWLFFFEEERPRSPGWSENIWHRFRSEMDKQNISVGDLLDKVDNNRDRVVGVTALVRVSAIIEPKLTCRYSYTHPRTALQAFVAVDQGISREEAIGMIKQAKLDKSENLLADLQSKLDQTVLQEADSQSSRDKVRADSSSSADPMDTQRSTGRRPIDMFKSRIFQRRANLMELFRTFDCVSIELRACGWLAGQCSWMWSCLLA